MKKNNEKSLKGVSMNKENFVAFIPVRGGSKSIPSKNVKDFCGKPLVYWVLKAAAECSAISKVYVSTDSKEIKECVERLNISNVIVVGRSAETANDYASTESAMIEFAEQYDFNNIVLIQATSPLLQSIDLDNAIAKYIKTKSDSLLSVARQKRFLWQYANEYAKPVNYNPQKRPRRQEWEGFFVENGAFYITSRENLLSSRCRISGNIELYEMKDESYFEIDEESDWLIAEQLKKVQLNNIPNENINFDNIKLLVCDVDGVLTDAGMYYSPSGDVLKKFNTRDGKGIELVRKAGIKVMWLTSENTDIVRKRAEKLKIDYLFMGISDKLEFIKQFFDKNNNYNFESTAYIGDDINDLECLKKCSFSAVPRDCIEIMKEAAKHICRYNGGQGCVREICDLIISRREYV